MLDTPPNNKMMQSPPVKKGFHFASDGIHFAQFIEAATIEEATELYHKLKQPMLQSTTPTTAEPGAGGVE